MAANDYTEPSPEQMKVAFSEIASMARSLRALCCIDIDNDSRDGVVVAAEKIASQIGWVADRCLGFECDTPDGWLLPSSWKTNESEAHHG